MTKIPLPQPWTDEESDVAEGLELQLSRTWRDALDWAKKGDSKSLAAMLRDQEKLCERDVLDYLADVLDGKIKKPRGKPPARPARSFMLDGQGNLAWDDERDELVFKIRKWVRDNKAKYGHDVFRKAASKFERTVSNVENLCRRSLTARKHKRSIVASSA